DPPPRVGGREGVLALLGRVRQHRFEEAPRRAVGGLVESPPRITGAPALRTSAERCSAWVSRLCSCSARWVEQTTTAPPPGTDSRAAATPRGYIAVRPVTRWATGWVPRRITCAATACV